MARQELHSESLPKIEQMPPITDASSYDGDIVIGDKVLDLDYAAELAFMEEAVTIRLQPSAERNAATSFPCWVNGRGAEVLLNGRWVEFKYLPVAHILTTKRKYLEVIVRSKVDTLSTPDMDKSADQAEGNRLTRFTSPVASFSVIEDRNPKGAAWLSELMRRNF